MSLKAVFFDRDGTLVYNDPAWEQFRSDKLLEWSGKPFDTSYNYFIRTFQRVMEGGFPFAPYRTVEEECAFFRQWYFYVFDDLGITDRREERADCLVQHLWYWKKKVYPETVEVLRYFQDRGCRMGVISDSPPSLKMTLQLCGLADYFTSFTASSLVGAGKPSPLIFGAALEAQGVTAEESLFVDDSREEADGAREQGFTAFRLDRECRQPSGWVIRDLSGLVAYAQTL